MTGKKIQKIFSHISLCHNCVCSISDSLWKPPNNLMLLSFQMITSETWQMKMKGIEPLLKRELLDFHGFMISCSCPKIRGAEMVQSWMRCFIKLLKYFFYLLKNVLNFLNPLVFWKYILLLVRKFQIIETTFNFNVQISLT